MPSLIGPEVQCLQVSYGIPFRVLGPTLHSLGDFAHYCFKEISVDHRGLTTFCRRFFRSLSYAKFTAIKSHLDLTYYQFILLSLNNFGPWKSNLHLFFFIKPRRQLFSDLLISNLKNLLVFTEFVNLNSIMNDPEFTL